MPVAQRHCLVQLDDRERGNRRERIEHARDVSDAGAVAVVLDNCQNRPAGAAVDVADVVPELRRVDLDPRIERRIADGRDVRPRGRLRQAEGRRRRRSFQETTA